MNKNLNEAIFDIAKVDALLAAYENTYLNFDIMPEEQERANRAEYAFHAVWDAVRKVADDLECLAGDERVVDAIYAVSDVRRRTLKNEN